MVTATYTIEKLVRHYVVCYIILIIGYNVLSKVFKVRDSKAHWYFLHSIGNAYICMVTLSDVFNVFIEPEYALFRPIELSPINYSNSIMIGAMHSFHLIAYWKDITKDDLFHHLLFVTFNQAAQFYPFLSGWESFQWGSALNAINFFACGLPGGLDYFFLGLTKINKMDRLTHKRLQAIINVWLRCPGIFGSVSISLFESYRNYGKVPFSGVVISHCCFVLIGYNAIHYMERVVLSAGRNLKDFRGTS